jgi:hypothetical protein
VLDNLITNTLAARYEAFPPAEARRIVERLPFLVGRPSAADARSAKSEHEP